MDVVLEVDCYLISITNCDAVIFLSHPFRRIPRLNEMLTIEYLLKQ